MIHAYKYKKNNIIIDIESGAIHLVSPIAFKVLEHAINLFNKDSENSPANFLGEIEQAQSEDKAPDTCSIHTGKSLCDGCLPGQTNYYKELVLRASNHLIQDDNSEDILQATAELLELIDDGELFVECQTDENLLANRQTVVKALCLHLAHDCNMACEYCFGDKGAFMGERELMSLDVAKNAIDFLLDNSFNRQNLEVDFFGGEPLMNFEVLKETVHYAKTKERELKKTGKIKKIRFTLTTNGLLLDEEKTNFINEYMDNVILSIDGRKQTNDRLRKTTNGQGTYKLILPKLLAFTKKRESNKDETKRLYYVRGTYTKYNLDFYEDILHLNELGFKNISVEPAVVDAKKPYALDNADLSELFLQYEKLAVWIEKKRANGEELNFFHFNIDLEGGPCEIKRASGCGAGLEYMAIAPNGDIYPCHQFVGEQEWCLGTVLDRSFNNSKADKFGGANILTKPACQTCFAKYYCSGGCHANAIHKNGNILEPEKLGCELLKKRVELALGILANSKHYLCQN
jgi:uncharacterized protein